MAGPSRTRATIKFLFWTVIAVGLFGYAWHAHRSGQLAAWYYHTAATDGFAVNASTFMAASKAQPAVLAVAQQASIEGLVAVPVKKGERLPRNANGVIATRILKEGKRATLAGNQITITVPWEIQQAKGFKFKDTFKHKGIETYPWAALWNVLMIFAIGLALGLMAEGFTDLLGMKIEKIQHHGH